MFNTTTPLIIAAIIGIFFTTGCTPESYVQDPNSYHNTIACPDPSGIVEVYHVWGDLYVGWYDLKIDGTVMRYDGASGTYTIANGELTMSFLNGDVITFAQDPMHRCYWDANPTGTGTQYFEVDRQEVTGRD